MKSFLSQEIRLISLVFFTMLIFSFSKGHAKTLNIDHKEATPGETVLVAVRGSDFTNIRGFQFQILYDNSKLEFTGIKNIHPNFSGVKDKIYDTYVLVTYSNLYSTSDLPDNAAIFYLEFNYCMDLPTCSINGTTSSLVFNEDQCMVIEGASVVVPATYNNGSVYSDTPIYTLYATTSGAGKVTVDGVDYTEPVVVLGGTSLSLNAIGTGTSAFTGWSGDLSGTTTPQNLIMNSNKSVNASFSGEVVEYTLNISTVGNGTVTVNGVPYTEPITVNQGTVLSLDVNPDEGWQFDGWSGALYGTTSPQDLVMDSNKEVTATFTEIPTYTLTVNVTGSGSVTVNGDLYTAPLTIQEGTTLTLASSPAEGWQFDGWSGALSGITSPQDLVMNSDKSVTATFTEIPTYTLTVNVTGSGSVTVNGDLYTAPLTVQEGTTLTLASSPDEGWKFDGWSGALSGTTSPQDLVMNSDKSVTATFTEIPSYTLTLNISGSGTVLVNGDPYTSPMLIEQDTPVTLTANPLTGYTFTGFSGDLTAATSPQTFNMDGDKNITATFTIKTYTLTINTSGNGTVEVDGTPYTGQLIFEHGDTPSLEAIPGDFHDFEGWSGSMSGAENPKSITMDGNKTVTASFTPFQYTLTINITGSGSVTVDGSAYSTPVTFEHGENPALSAIASEGWQFEGWSGDLTGSTNPQNILMDGNKEVTATFTIKQYTLTIEKNGNGSVLVNGDPYTDPLVFNHGDTPELHALPDENWRFVSWSGDLEGSTTPQTLVMNGDKNVTAGFALKQYTLTINITGNGIVHVNGAIYNEPLVFDHGSTPSLEAIADEFNNFDGWSGDLSGSDNPQNIEMTDDRTVNAAFSPFQYTLTVNTTGNGSVTVNSGAYTDPITFDHGDTPLIQANAESGWVFSGWTGDLESNNNPVNLLINGNKNITANFERQEHILTINFTGLGKVYVNGIVYTGPMVFDNGDTPSLEAEAGDYYNFSGWGGDLSGSTNPESLFMDGNKSVQAFFTPFEYTLTIDTSGQGMVEVNGVAYTEPIVFSHGDQPQIRAYADAGWQFDAWSGDLNGSVNPVNLLMDNNKNVTAHFSEIPPDFYTLTVSINGGGNVLVNSTAYTSPMGFEDGTELTLEAIPDAGWVFTGWSGDLSGSESPANLTMTIDKSITATFERQQYTLTAGLTGAGEVWVNGALYTNPLSFAFEDTPQIQAIPDEGWLFDSWSGDLAGADNPTELFMDDDKSVTAHFSEIPATYTLTITTQGSGSVLVDGNAYGNPVAFLDQESATLEAIPAEGWLFDGWSGDLQGNDNPDDLLMDDYKSVTALFTEIPVATYTLTVSLAGNGSVKVDEQDYAQPLTFNEGTQANLEAIPDEGWQFDGWSGNLQGNDNPIQVVMDGDKNVTAQFSEIPPVTVTLTLSAVGNGMIRVNDEPYVEPVILEKGSQVALEAIPDEGWQFDGWTGDLNGQQNPVVVTMDDNKNITATFTETPPPTYMVTFIVSDDEGTAINNATIQFDGETHPEGTYVFEGLEAGDYPYTVLRDGYFDKSDVVSIVSNDVIEVVVLEVDDTSVDSISLENKILVYPNPAHHILNIESRDAITEVRLVNITGQIVLTKRAASTPIEVLDISQLKSGMYFLQVLTADQIQTLKVQISK